MNKQTHKKTLNFKCLDYQEQFLSSPKGGALSKQLNIKYDIVVQVPRPETHQQYFHKSSLHIIVKMLFSQRNQLSKLLKVFFLQHPIISLFFLINTRVKMAQAWDKQGLQVGIIKLLFCFPSFPVVQFCIWLLSVMPILLFHFFELNVKTNSHI